MPLVPLPLLPTIFFVTNLNAHFLIIVRKNNQFDVTINMVATGQEIVKEKKNSSRSGKSQGISL